MKQAVQHANDAEHNARVDCEGGERKNGERIEQIKMAEQTDAARQRDQSQLAGSRLRLLKMRPRHFIVFLELSMKKFSEGIIFTTEISVRRSAGRMLSHIHRTPDRNQRRPLSR